MLRLHILITGSYGLCKCIPNSAWFNQCNFFFPNGLAFPSVSQEHFAAARAGRARWCHSKPSTVLLFAVFGPRSFTSSSSSQGPLQFSELCKKPCHFFRPPRCPSKYRLLLPFVTYWLPPVSAVTNCNLQLRLMENLYHHKTPSYLPLSCPGPHRDLTSKGYDGALLTGSKEQQEFAPDLPPHPDFPPPPSAKF